jgi:hypothetical protein
MVVIICCPVNRSAEPGLRPGPDEVAAVLSELDAQATPHRIEALQAGQLMRIG